MYVYCSIVYNEARKQRYHEWKIIYKVFLLHIQKVLKCSFIPTNSLIQK